MLQLYVRFSNLCCDNALLMFWLGLDTKTTRLRLEKDHVLIYLLWLPQTQLDMSVGPRKKKKKNTDYRHKQGWRLTWGLLKKFQWHLQMLKHSHLHYVTSFQHRALVFCHEFCLTLAPTLHLSLVTWDNTWRVVGWEKQSNQRCHFGLSKIAHYSQFFLTFSRPNSKIKIMSMLIDHENDR